jgi:phage-related protein
MAQPEWSIVFYERGDSAPVREFLETLDKKTQVRFVWSIEQLRRRNVQARKPLVDHVEGKIWELREESQTNIYRLLYFMASGRRIVFLHGFQKKTQKTPRRDIDVAQQRLDEFNADEGRES